VAYIIDVVCTGQNIAKVVRGENYRCPWSSIFLKGCMEKGLDMTQGGAKNLNNLIGPHGHQNVANSLAAIKKVVFEDKAITMDELLDALACNFEGREDVHHLLLSAPKWGNDDDYVDNIVRDDSSKQIMIGL